MTFDDFQALIETMYSHKDRARGTPITFMWLCEEFGELATALREGSHEEKCGEFADVLAWLATVANINNVNLDEALRKKYGSGCPGCGKWVCTCQSKQ
ncbi:MAG: hypothetical protein FLDDKLPJ_01633 [Phycisphaerae bacterium]|nr:hypothetical protein [Phycisphaerae bacterium]